MPAIRHTLARLRQLRLWEAVHRENAAEYLHRATQGVGARRAMDIGGTGDCPLTQNAGRYTKEHTAAEQARREADTLWTGIAPGLAALELDPRSVIELKPSTTCWAPA